MDNYESKHILSTVYEKQLLGTLLTLMRPPKVLSSREWGEAHRVLGSDVSAIEGSYRGIANPVMLQVMDCVDNPDIKVIVCIKSAQIGWTEAINNCIGKRMDLDPANMIIAFPSQNAGVSYAQEKFRPFVKSTPRLLYKIGDPDKCSWNRYRFDGGFIKFVTASSVSQIKSTPSNFIDVEEPDDLTTNLKNQGDSLGILKERLKSYDESKLIYGGTPSYHGTSRVAEAYKHSCQYEYHVPCHECGEFHILSFDNLNCVNYADMTISEKYGELDPETVIYSCPHCKVAWSDKQKNLNILKALDFNDQGWRKKFPEKQEVGFRFNELMSVFKNSDFISLAQKQLAAEHSFAQGRESELIVFTNNSKGEPYENKAMEVTIQELKDRALSYPEGKVVKEGLTLTMGIDVQHNRFAYIVRAWGASGNSWLVKHEEIFGNVLNPQDKVWRQLQALCKRGYAWLGKTGVRLYPAAISIDSSDGSTTEFVYNFVKTLNAEGINIMAIKGSSESFKEAAIFSFPSGDLSTKVKRIKTLAETMGVVVHAVGTNRAKDLILRQLQKSTETNDRMYYYSTVSTEYFKQLLSNSKRLVGIRIRYFKKYGQRDEAIDTEVYGLHAARSLFLHLRTDEDWANIKEILLQDPEELKTGASPAEVVGKTGLGSKFSDKY